jgi:hypothetical protein
VLCERDRVRALKVVQDLPHARILPMNLRSVRRVGPGTTLLHQGRRLLEPWRRMLSTFTSRRTQRSRALGIPRTIHPITELGE